MDSPPKLHGQRTESLFTGAAKTEAVCKASSFFTLLAQPQVYTPAFVPSAYDLSIHHGRLARIRLHTPTTSSLPFRKQFWVIQPKIIPAYSDEDDLS